MKKALNAVLIALFLYGIGWSGNNDYEYREGQVKKELARINKQEGK